MNYFSEEFNAINSKFDEFIREKNTILEENTKLKKTIESLELENKKIAEECDNYSKVSVVKNLHNQIFEKDNLIKLLEKKINDLKQNNINLEIVEKEADEEEEEAVADEEEEEVEEVEEAVEVEEEAVEVEEVDGEEVEEEEAVEVEEVDGEEEVEFYEKRLKPPNCKDRKLKLFLITDDEYKDIYDILDNGEPGKHIGKLVGKQNKPFFFK